MTLEEELTEIIVKKYGSIKYFAEIINIPYTTLITILKRGIMKSNIQNVLSICKELNIDSNAIEEGKIVKLPNFDDDRVERKDELDELFEHVRDKLTEEDIELMKVIMNKHIKEIDNELDNEGND